MFQKSFEWIGKRSEQVQFVKSIDKFDFKVKRREKLGTFLKTEREIFRAFLSGQ